MNFKKLLKSRTVWTVAVLFLISGVKGITEFIPAGWLPLIQGVLSLLAMYFRVDAKVDFKKEE